MDHVPLRTSARILALRPNVTREEAEARLRGGGVARMFGGGRAGPLRSLALIRIPFVPCEVEVRSGGKESRYVAAVDAVRGDLDLLMLDDGLDPGICEPGEPGRNDLEALIEPERAAVLAREKMRRALYTRGFFRLRNLTIRAEAMDVRLMVPYWTGFFGAGAEATVRVMDAVRRRVEGRKVRDLIVEWLVSEGGEGRGSS